TSVWIYLDRCDDVGAASGSESKGRDKGLQLFLGRFYFSCCIPDGGRQGGDRGFGFAELVEGLLVQRRIASDRREIVAQPLFVFDKLMTLLLQLLELGVLPSKRLP